MKNIFVVLFLTFVLTLFSYDTQRVISRGYGENIEAAKKNALKNALEQVIGVYIDGESYVENFVTIKDNIYSSTEGYIDKYKIIKEEKDDKGAIIITIEADVINTNLQKDLDSLGLILEKMDMPRILVANFIDSNNKTKDVLIDKCYSGIVEVLVHGEYFVLDKSTLLDFFKQQKDIAYSELNNRIAEYGLKVNADYIVRFDLRMENGAAYCDVEVISSSTGKIITSVVETAEYSVKSSYTEQIIAARNLGKKIANKLYGNILKNWKKSIKTGKYFTLIIEGYRAYKDVLSFENSLENIKNINAVSEIESGNKKTSILVRYKGNRKELKDNIFYLLKKNGWSVRLIRSENNRMFIKILK